MSSILQFNTGLDKFRMTAALSITKSGILLKGFIILRNLVRGPKVNLPENIYLTVSKSGSMSTSFMLLYLGEIIRPYIPANEKCLLILDSLSSHVTDEVIRKATQLKLILLKYLKVFDFEALLELERKLTLQSQEIEQEFNSDFIRV